MNIGFANRIGYAALLLLSSSVMICAEEPARLRGTPIIFSGPKSDAVSTNLNDLRTPTTSRSLHDLESGLKQSFPGLDTPRTEPNINANRSIQQQPQPLNRKSLKDSLNQRAEDMFLNPELYEADKEDEAMFQLDRISLDPSRAKPKNSLERFDERQRNDRATQTNRGGINNLFGNQNLGRPDELKSDSKLIKPFKTGQNPDAGPDGSLSVFPRIAAESSAMSTERSPTARHPSGFNRPIEAPTDRQQEAVEARMDDFKRLLEGPRYTPPANTLATSPANYGRTTSGNLTTTTATRSTTTPSSISEWSAFKSSKQVETKPDFAKSAGLVGSPEKLEAFPQFPTSATALEPVKPITPEPVKKAPPTTFKLPQRRF